MIKNYRINESKATMESMGAEKLTTEELLSIILGNQEKAAKILHQEDAVFKATQDDLKYLVRQDYDSLKNVGNLTRNETARIFAAIELGRRIANIPNTEAKRISSPGDAAQHLMAGLRYATHEKFVVVLLDTKNHVMKTKQISEGSLSSSVVHPREVFAPAVTAHAASIVVAHMVNADILSLPISNGPLTVVIPLISCMAVRRTLLRWIRPRRWALLSVR